MARGDGGKIYAGTRAIGRVYEITDTGSQRTSRVVVDKLVQPAASLAFAPEEVAANRKAWVEDWLKAMSK